MSSETPRWLLSATSSEGLVGSLVAAALPPTPLRAHDGRFCVQKFNQLTGKNSFETRNSIVIVVSKLPASTCYLGNRWSPALALSELHLHPARAIGSRVTTRSCAVCARTRNVVRRSLGDHSSTRARTRGVCSPDSPEKDTAIFSSRSVESSSPPCPHDTQPVRLLPYWDMSAIFVLPSPSDACAPLPAGEDRRRAPTRFVREARGATRVARASAEPACRPSLGPPPGPRGRRFGPPGKEGGSDTAKRCFRGPHELAFIPSAFKNIYLPAVCLKCHCQGGGRRAGGGGVSLDRDCV